jgi:hypothetical protein
VTDLRVPLRVLGVLAVVECTTAELADRVRRDWSRCLSAERGNGAESVGGADDDVVTVSLEPAKNVDGALYVMTTGLTYRLIDRLTGSVLMFHACGLSDDDGNVLILVAPSGTGKSTAASVLARSAFGYVTDETVVVRPDGTVAAYEKPLSFVTSRFGSERKSQKGPDDLGLREPPAALHPARVVVLDRDTAVRTPILEPLTLVEGMVEVIPQTSALPALERPLQQLAALLERCGGVYRLRYAEIADAEDLLAVLLAGEVEPTEEWEPLAREKNAEDEFVLLDGRLTVLDFDDAVRTEDEAVVLTDGVPRHLQGIGTTLWSAVLDGVRPDRLVDAVVDVHGDHPEAAAMVAAAMAAMEDAGLLIHRVPLTLAQVLAGESRDDGSRWQRVVEASVLRR